MVQIMVGLSLFQGEMEGRVAIPVVNSLLVTEAGKRTLNLVS